MSVGIVDKSTGERIQTAGNPLDKVGDLTNLTTTAKNNAVSAINEVNAGLTTKQDTLTFDSVPTDGSTNPVESNGVFDALATKANATDVSTALALKQNATDNSLDTTAKNIVGAINEHAGDIGSLKSGLIDVNSNLTSLLLGNVKQIQLTQTYGHDQDKPINIDVINNPNGYVVKVRDSYTFTGTFPPLGSNNCLIIGFSAMTDQNAPIYGAQIAFAFGEDRIAIRHASYVQAGGTWGSWKVLDAVSP